jgi:U2-associated protein SR140
MKMGWGKPVPIPLQPIYVPPALLELSLPPEPTGLPFNCQPLYYDDIDIWAHGPDPHDDNSIYEFGKMLNKSKVKVVIPTDRTQLCLINRLVEFVIREGPMFEAMMMNREINNRSFQFLFENQSPEHIYYRWRLFSMLQGIYKQINFKVFSFNIFIIFR